MNLFFSSYEKEILLDLLEGSLMWFEWLKGLDIISSKEVQTIKIGQTDKLIWLSTSYRIKLLFLYISSKALIKNPFKELGTYICQKKWQKGNG